MSVTTGGMLANNNNNNRLVCLKPAQEQCLWETDRLDMTLDVDRAVKPEHKQGE